MCAVVCVLLLSIAKRFQSDDIWAISSTLGRMVLRLDAPDLERLRLSVFEWYDRLFECKTRSALARKLGLILNTRDDNPSGVCNVLLDSRRTCQMARATDRAFCSWQDNLALNLDEQLPKPPTDGPSN